MAETRLYGQHGADPYPIPDDLDDQSGAEEEEHGEMTDADPGEAATGDEVPTLGEAPGDDDPQGQAAYRHWQGVFTRHRERDVAENRKLRDEHAQFSDVLARFNRDDDFALGILRERFPHLATQLAGQSSAQRQPQAGQQGTTAADLLQQHLGQDLGFLAPSLAPAIEAVVNQLVGSKVGPLEQRISKQSEEARQREEDRLMVKMDSINEHWRERYGADMKELDDFMAGDALEHPKFGSKYELYHKLLNPDAARIEAARGMGNAARRAVRTGRSGETPAPNVAQQMARASNDKAAWDLAVNAAIAETEGR